ncbi:hypothetical protein ACW7GZ_14355 [Luteimonas sp. A537]
MPNFLSTSLHLSVPALLSVASLTACAEQHRIVLNDCRVSFIVPKNLDYIEIEGATLEDDVNCIIAFSKSVQTSSPSTVGQPEGWREQTDYVIEVKRVSLTSASLDYSLTPGGDEAYKLDESGATRGPLEMRLASLETFQVANGTGLIANIEILDRPRNMADRGVDGQVVYLVGNKALSANYALWPSSSNEEAQRELDAMTSLFKSFSFLE